VVSGTAPTHIVPTNHGDVVPEDLAVVLAQGITADQATELATSLGGAVRMYDPGTGLGLFTFGTGDAASRVMPELQSDSRVRVVAPNYVMYAASPSACNAPPTILQDPVSQYQWNLPAANFPKQRPSASGVVVAELDTGIAYEDYVSPSGEVFAQAPDLAQTHFAPGANEIDSSVDPVDDNRHGTHVAGIIASGAGPLGIAPDVTLMPVKVLDNDGAGSEVALAEGLIYATDHNARIINMSLSFPETYFPSEILQAAIDYAVRHGVVLVAAAGNFAANDRGQSEPVTFPAALHGVIAVGAARLATSSTRTWQGWRRHLNPQTAPWERWSIDADDLGVSSYSDSGAKLDVLAPGGEVHKDLDGDHVDEAILATTFSPGCPATFSPWMWAGTSQATAHVTGLAALLLGQDPALDADTLTNLIGSVAARPGASDKEGFDATIGRGYLQASSTLRLDTALASGGSQDGDSDGDGAVVQLPAAGPFYADVQVAMHSNGGEHAVATVALVDGNLHPAADLHVYGAWSGSVVGQVDGVTDSSGQITFSAPPFAGAPIAGFEVDSVVQPCASSSGRGQSNNQGNGSGGCASAVFARPRGFVDADVQSLVELSAFAGALLSSPTSVISSAITVTPSANGLLVNPGNVALSSGVIQEPGYKPPVGGPGTTSSGIIQEPGGPTPGYVATEPALGIAYAGSAFTNDTTYVSTVTLPNVSWGLSNMPINVAVDQSYLTGLFPSVSGRIVTSLGLGLPGSPLLFDASSFPTRLSLDDTLKVSPTISVAVFTYGAAQLMSASSSLDSSSGVLATASGIIQEPGYKGTSAPLVLDAHTQSVLGTNAQSYQNVLNAWRSFAIGDSTTPPPFAASSGVPQSAWTALGLSEVAYSAYASSVAAIPVLSFPNILAASGTSAPAATATGDGAGSSAP
jgi:serine protease